MTMEELICEAARENFDPETAALVIAVARETNRQHGLGNLPVFHKGHIATPQEREIIKAEIAQSYRDYMNGLREKQAVLKN